jgi:hypothetical protein
LPKKRGLRAARFQKKPCTLGTAYPHAALPGHSVEFFGKRPSPRRHAALDHRST